MGKIVNDVPIIIIILPKHTIFPSIIIIIIIVAIISKTTLVKVYSKTFKPPEVILVIIHLQGWIIIEHLFDILSYLQIPLPFIKKCFIILILIIKIPIPIIEYLSIIHYTLKHFLREMVI